MGNKLKNWSGYWRTRRRLKQRTFYYTALGLALWLAALAYIAPSGIRESTWWGRRLLSGGGSCDKSSFAAWEKNGGVAVYFIGVLYLFIGIAIICDDFFVSSLEAISEKLGLSEDVAGATFMAAGSSAPELFSSLVALANDNTSSEIGIGTIVGSAVFNILVIIGVTAIFAGRVLELDWKPLARDAFFYTAAICGVIGIFADEKVYWWEGLLSVVAYGVYIIFMKFNSSILTWLDNRVKRSNRVVSAGKAGAVQLASKEKTGEAAHLAEDGVATPSNVDVQDKKPGGATPSGEQDVESGWIQAGREGDKEAERTAGAGQSGKAEEEDDKDPFALPERGKDYPLWLLSLPWYVAFTFTVPNCKKEKWEKFYLLTFFMSIFWIGCISWFMVEWAADIGCLLNIPEAIMGVTVLAAGTSIPDALASIVVAKQGMGDMAVANAVGSNVFDIWLGLGLPWLFIIPFKGMKDAFGHHIVVENGQLTPNIMILFGVLIFYLGVVSISRLKLYPKMGIVFVVVYGFYALYNIIVVWLLDVYGAD